MTEHTSENRPNSGAYSVRAVERAVLILEILRAADSGLSLNELALRTKLPKASVFRMLRTLASTGLIERVSGRDVYRLGVRCLALGQAYLEQTDLRSEARPVLEKLRSRFDETVHLAVLDDELRVVYLEKLETPHAIGLMMSWVGRTVPAYCTGIGKALLTGYPADPVSELERRGALRRFTPNTICDPEQLRRELEACRRSRYALDLEEHEPGVSCVGCPVKGAHGEVIAAISIAGPSQRLPHHLLAGKLAEATLEAALEISHRLGGV